MHERTQRAIARLLFVFTCAVPTAITLLSVLITWTPWYAQGEVTEMEGLISRYTGLEVHVDRIRRPSPSETWLYDVHLLDPETDQEIAFVHRVYWSSDPDRSVIQLHQPKLQSSELSSTWKMIHDDWLCNPENTRNPIELVVHDLTIASQTGASSMKTILGWIRPDEDSVSASVDCWSALNPDDPAIQLKITRDRRGTPATSWELDTGGTALPCSALAGYLPQLRSLGPDAMFRGRMRWQIDSSNWWIDLSESRFEQVLLDGLTSHTHRLTGLATIHFDHCYIAPLEGRSEFSGILQAREGWIGKSLLLNARDFLRFEVHPITEQFADDFYYDKIAIAFDARDSQMKLDGVCRGLDSQNAGVVLERDDYPVVTSKGQPIFATDVIAAIAPPHSVMVPIAGQTDWIMRLLVPPDRPTSIGQTRPRVGLVPSVGKTQAVGQPY